jgi:hypothetical protein
MSTRTLIVDEFERHYIERCNSLRSKIYSDSFPHHFNDDAFSPLSIKFGIIDGLPRSQIQLSMRNWQNNLVMHEQIFEMCIAVHLACAVMMIVRPLGRQLTQPLVNVLNESFFRIIHIDRCRNMHR